MISDKKKGHPKNPHPHPHPTTLHGLCCPPLLYNDYNSSHQCWCVSKAESESEPWIWFNLHIRATEPDSVSRLTVVCPEIIIRSGIVPSLLTVDHFNGTWHSFYATCSVTEGISRHNGAPLLSVSKKKSKKTNKNQIFNAFVKDKSFCSVWPPCKWASVCVCVYVGGVYNGLH